MRWLLNGITASATGIWFANLVIKDKGSLAWVIVWLLTALLINLLWYIENKNKE